MNTYEEIFIAVGATGLISVMLYFMISLSNSRVAGLPEFAFLGSVIVFICTAGIGATSCAGLMNEDSKAMMREMDGEISARYDFTSLGTMTVLVDKAEEGDWYIESLTGDSIMRSLQKY